jgi:valyl-tRNA synthetase
MEKNYDHKKYEEKIYSLWEKSGAFTPKVDKLKKPFCIIMPPPNANDPLHIGHVRFVTIEDALIRYKRMCGFPTLWLPGADHAGIETQYVYEKTLAKEGKSRFDFDRQTLYQNIWDYVQKNKAVMESQLKQLGASCDWTRNVFTLNPKIINIVYKAFKRLYDDGLIYRGERIINYCPRCGTAYSQLEVNYVERDDNLYYINYGALVIATTRPETIFADVAVAINPKDRKYKNLIGKMVTLPLVNRKLPIIEDPLVDIDFGTGVLKITPGHDPTDFEIGQKHKLPIITVIDTDGKMINTPDKYKGMNATRAREEVVSDLKKAGVLEKIENIHHVVGTCYRDHSLIEPLISKQWFIKVEKLAKESLSAINGGKVRFTAKKYEKIAKYWLKNLKDWNISRQIVWGIRIPAFKCNKCLVWTITDGDIPKKCKCGSSIFTQDPDTFDTWFSSGQWPYATLFASSGIPNFKFPISKDKYKKADDFNYFYPTSIMETAYDILPFWVLRMIMLDLYLTGDVPFREVLIHGLVRDSGGQKISKSKGNVIDPIEMSNKYGSDSLRMGIIWGALLENDISLSEDNIRAQRNFSNKIWNVARFVLSHKQSKSVKERKSKNNTNLNTEDKWILRELKRTTEKVTKALDKYRLNEAAEEIYNFVWHKFADKYLESIKEKTDGEVMVRESAIPTLHFVLDRSLRLLHPFMPFVTEVIWQETKELRKNANELLITAEWPS